MRISNFFKIVPLLATAWLMSAPRADAAPLTLINPAPADQQYQQTLNSPCVIGEPSCQDPAGWTHTNFPAGGGTQTYDSTSPTYTVGQINTIVGTSLLIGIDVNTAGTQDCVVDGIARKCADEQLDLLEVLINGVQQFVYNPASPGTRLVTSNNGNGFADVLLSGLDLSGFAVTDTVVFHAIINTATDGREQIFLINTANPPPVVPEPASLTLLGGGLLGIAQAIRRRRRLGQRS